MMHHVRASLAGIGVAVGLFVAGPASAGPFILAGTDADDHGGVSGSVNQDGWFFMQRAIENLAPGVTNGNKVVVALGSNPGSQAASAAASAFNLSTLPGLGWTFVNLNGATAINDFFAGSGATHNGNTGIVMLDSGGNVGGGLDGSETAALTANAIALNNFLGAGGGLFSQSNGYGFLSALIPGATAPDEFQTGIALTAAGNSAFPGLSDADLSAGPYHNRFENFGTIPVLGTSTGTGNPVIIGASGGTITNPTPVPEPVSLSLFGLGLLGLGAMRMKNRARAA